MMNIGFIQRDPPRPGGSLLSVISPRNFNFLVEVNSEGTLVRTLGEGMLVDAHDPEFLVFTTRAGTPINRHNFTRDFQALLRREDLPKLRFHDLRHTAASLLLAQNVQPRDIMEVLGHSQIGLTMNLYSHVMKPALQNAADRMDSILAG